MFQNIQKLVLKKILVYMLLLILILPVFSLSVFADSTKNYKINSLEQLKTEIAIIHSKTGVLDAASSDIKNILETTDPDIVNSFLLEKLTLLKSKTSNPSEYTYTHKIDLGDGCYVNIKNSEPLSPSNNIVPFSTPGAQTLWKDYGSRKFTSTFEGNLALAKFQVNICNHYTLSGQGITPRYVEAWGKGAGAIQVTTGTVYETKRSAKIGETVSSNCTFTASIIGKSQVVFKMYNNIKCSDIDTINKQVKVVQSWRGDYI